jgi:PAS domain S-box-containing protein
MSELIDNRAQRIRTLKQVIRELHRGVDPQKVKNRLKQLVQQCDAGEIAAMEQELMAEGVPVEEIMGMCDLHSQVVRELIVQRSHAPVQTGHPVDVFRKENAALAERSASMRAALSELAATSNDAAMSSQVRERARGLFNEVMGVDQHYQRKENLLFPILERHGMVGPSKVMWGKDDEVRELLGALGEALSAEDAGSSEWALVAETVGYPAVDALEEMIQKEEKILLPMSLQTLTEAEWGEIWSQSPEFGWCLVDPEGEYRAPALIRDEIPKDVADEAERSGVALKVIQQRVPTQGPPSGAIVFPTGSLQLDQLRAIFCTLPVDMTFVDAEDRVRFFSEGPERIFARPKAVIGRKVQHCHPPSSVHVIDQILSDFKQGRQNVAEFWINLRRRFVHIRYFAVRDEQERYKGTLEVTQDLTELRELEGERRLLQYG